MDPVLPRAHLCAVEPTRESLIALLRQEKVEEFNRLRPREPRTELRVLGASLPEKELDLSNVDLSRLVLRGADFSNVLLSNSDFSDSDLRDCQFAFAHIERAQFRHAQLKGASFRRVSGIERNSVYEALQDAVVYGKRIDFDTT